MKKYNYITPIVKGLNKTIELIDEEGNSIANIQRYYPKLLSIIAELFLTSWEINVKASQDDKEYFIKHHFHWTKNEWSIFENGTEIGTFKNVKKIELGDTKEITIHGKKYYYFNKFLETQSAIQDENKKIIAVINFKLFDISRKKEIVIHSDEVSVSLLVCIDFVSSLSK